MKTLDWLVIGVSSVCWSVGSVHAQSDWSVQYTQTGNISLGLDAIDSTRCWIAGGTNGIGPHVGRTTDGGNSWQWTFTDTAQALFWLDVDFSSPLVGYVSGMGVFAPGAAKTIDGGLSWTTLNPIAGVPFASGWADVFALDDTHVWYAGFAGGILSTKSGVAYSTDGGATFQFSDPNNGTYPKAVHFIDKNTGWLTSGEFPDDDGTGQFYGVVQKTTDGGATWSTPQMTTNDYTPYWLHFVDAQNGWVAADGPNDGVIFHTSDGGLTWETQSPPLNNGLHLADVEMFDTQHGWCVGWIPGSGGNPMVSLYETFDGGKNWQLDPFQPPYGPVQLSMVDENTGWTVGANNMQVGAIMAYRNDCPSPKNYCTATANSTGVPASMDWLGSTGVAANDLTLLTHDLPAKKFGLFFFGTTQVSVPLGNGQRCVGGAIYRLPVVASDSLGEARMDLDLGNMPVPGGSILMGETWNFQFWYREVKGVGAGYNFSDGLQVYFCD